jgi:hypothetical protein
MLNLQAGLWPVPDCRLVRAGCMGAECSTSEQAFKQGNTPLGNQKLKECEHTRRLHRPYCGTPGGLVCRSGYSEEDDLTQ